jgi:MFS family permease
MKEQQEKNSGIYPWVVVALLWVVALLNYMDRQVITTMRPSMQGDISDLSSAENFGRLMAIFLWIYGFASPLAGYFSDRLSRKWLIVGSLFVWSAVTYLMGTAGSFNELLWLRGIMGLSEAIYVPAALTLIADYHSGRTRALAVGIHMTGIYCGQALGGFGATIAELLSWQRAFHLFGIIGIIYAGILIFSLRESRTYSRSGLVADHRDENAGCYVGRSFPISQSKILGDPFLFCRAEFAGMGH